jgi:DNA-binding MarR family transcriptional regulator/GNAT superfamily N-acetyltransferase
MVEAASLATIRSFNRTVTQRIGVLDQEYLSRGRSLGASRLLWEIGRAGCDVRRLRARLRLDSGYLSRLLRALESEALVEVVAGSDDQRVRFARLTDHGIRELDQLDRLSDELAASMLAPLDDRRRQQLLEAVATVDRLLTAGMVTIDVADPRGDDARFCMESYFAELDSRFEDGFEQGLSTSVDYAEFAEPTGLLLIARLGDDPIGCGALKFHDGEPPDIKRMWIAPSARGLGVGRRMLSALEQQAAQRGAAVVRLETNRSLDEAIALYRSSGYVEVPAFNDEHYAHHWFQKALRTRADRSRC